MKLEHSVQFKFVVSMFALVSPFFLASLDAQDETTDEEIEDVVPITIEATEIETETGVVEYTRETLSTLPAGENSLGELLRLNPAVDFSRNSDLSAGAATLRPAEISIHGEAFYQNAFIIDGVDTTNDLNPADSEDVFQTPSLTAPLGGSSPQGYYVDLEQAESITVHDSNIPARFGGFTGGVVDVELRGARGREDEISFTYDLRRSEWEKFHMPEADFTSNDKFGGVYTPDYEKQHLRLEVVEKFNDTTGVIIGARVNTSTFAQEYENDADVLHMIDYDDSISNIHAGISTSIGQVEADVRLRHSKRTHDGVTSTTYTGSFEKSHSGSGMSAIFRFQRPNAAHKVIVGYDQLSDRLDSESSYFSYHESLEGSGMSRFEGSFGDIEQRQARFSVEYLQDFNAIEYNRATHNISTGVVYRTTDSYYERPADVLFEQFFCNRDMGREGCQDTDGSGRSDSGDEYLYRRSFYYEGKVDVQYQQAAAFVQDSITLHPIYLTVGLRGEWNGYLDNFDLSPRVSGTWVPEDGRFGAYTAGVNRYYGRSFLRYQLNDAIYGWRDSYIHLPSIRNRPDEQVPCSDLNFENCRYLSYDNRSGVSDLESPYSDEIALSWFRQLGPIGTRLSVVSRESKKGVTRFRDDEGRYVYSNDGERSTLSSTISLSSAEILTKFLPTELYMGFGYKETETNYQDTDGYDEQVDTDLIYYNGQIIPYTSLPAWDYNIPVSLRLFGRTRINGLDDLSIGWFVNYKRGGTLARDSRENYTSPETGIEYDIYEDFEFDSATTLDLRLKWENRVNNLDYFVQMDLKNAFDKVINVSTFATRPRATSGRVFWFVVGAKLQGQSN